MEVAIYECNWYSAPLQFKKLLLMFMLRCRKPVIVRGKPFYKLDLELLARVRSILLSLNDWIMYLNHCFRSQRAFICLLPSHSSSFKKNINIFNSVGDNKSHLF